MKATEILENEHRVIEQVLACLEQLAEQSEQSQELDCVSARNMIDFFRMFADRFHHAKEEQHLFMVLEAHGMPRDGGPTGVMLSEHELGRGFVGDMEKAVTDHEKGDATALHRFVRAAREYVPLLLEHIQKEDHCLFAMTNSALNEKEQEQLLQSFLAEEKKNTAGQAPGYYIQKAQELADRFDVKPRDCGTGMSSSCNHRGSGACSGH